MQCLESLIIIRLPDFGVRSWKFVVCKLSTLIINLLLLIQSLLVGGVLFFNFYIICNVLLANALCFVQVFLLSWNGFLIKNCLF